MESAITEVKTLLDRLPENSNYEDIQYHLYVLTKIKHSLERAKTEGTFSQVELEEKCKYQA